MAKLLILILLTAAGYAAADCGEELSLQQKAAKFKHLDEQAEAAVQAHRPTEAITLYEQAVCLAPSSPRGYYGLGVAEAEAGDFLRARDSLQTADRLQPTTAMALIMQVRVNYSLKDLDALKDNLRELASRFPHDAPLHDTLSRLLAERNLLVLALAESLRAQQAGASDPRSKVQLAVLENTVGAYSDAIRNAAEVEQDHKLANELRASAAGVAGLSYESLKQPQPATRYLREAIQLDPSQENSYLALADLFEQSQNYPEAVDVLEAARRNVAQSPAILLPLGADLIRAERYQAGLDVLRELLRRSPDTQEAYISMADVSHRLGNTSQEVKALEDLERVNPDYPMIHVLIARALLSDSRADYQKVLGELSLAEKAAPSDADVFYLRGKVYLSLGRYEEALSDLSHSIDLRPMEPTAYYQLGKVYQKLGKTEMAKQQFDRLKYLESTGTRP
jgi:tetratricopeptide (TPR) repeat protein